MKRFNFTVMQSLVKTILLFCFLMFFSNKSSSQSLSGEWQGFFKHSDSEIKDRIAFYFTSKADSSYKVYSYSKAADYPGNKFTVVCEVGYKKTGIDSIYLEEIKQIKPAEEAMICFQKMNLRIRQNEQGKLRLEGKWEFTQGIDCDNSYGEIVLTKK